jgi:hypothetical protein
MMKGNKSMKNRSEILMVILPVLACFALSPQAQAGESTFSCTKTASDVALELKVTNNGPDAVSNGTKVYYFYKTSARATHKKGNYTLTRKVKKGETFKIVISPSWQTPVVSCGVSLKPF